MGVMRGNSEKISSQYYLFGFNIDITLIFDREAFIINRYPMIIAIVLHFFIDDDHDYAGHSSN